MECISGLTREQVVGKSAFEIFPFLKEMGEDNYFYAALAGKSVISEKRPYAIPQTGRKGFFEGYYSPLRDPDGEVIGGVGIIRDITDRRHAAALARDDHQSLPVAAGGARLEVSDR